MKIINDKCINNRVAPLLSMGDIFQDPQWVGSKTPIYVFSYTYNLRESLVYSLCTLRN